MIKLFISSIVFGILITPATAQKNLPEPAMKTRTVQLNEKFSRIILNGDAVVVLVKDLKPEITIEEKEGFENSVRVKNRNGELTIQCREVLLGKKPLILIPVTQLDAIELNGNAHLSSAVMLQSKQLKVFVNGHCRLKLVSSGEILFDSSPDYYLDFKKQLGRVSPVTR